MKTIISFSGGMDSTTLLAWAMDQGEVEAVHFQYGSKHNRHELEAMMAVAQHYSIPVRICDLQKTFSLFKSNLLSGQGEIPEGHYEAESMKATVVPARNIIFSSILAGLGESLEADQIALGIHSGDHAIYPDCRPTFFHSMKEAIWYGTEKHIQLEAPFLNWNKTEILRWGVPRNVPYHLTRTCYKDQKLSCGRCGSCQERLEAFGGIGLADPIGYSK